MTGLLSDCCNEGPQIDTEPIDGKEAGICSGCGENTEFHYEDGCYVCGGTLKKVNGSLFTCTECAAMDEYPECER